MYYYKNDFITPMELNFDDSKDLNILDNVPKNVSQDLEWSWTVHLISRIDQGWEHY